MTKKNWIFSITVGIVLGIIGGLFGVTRLLQAKPVSAASPADEALLATLTSHLKWSSVQGEANIIWYGPNGEKQEYINTFTIRQPNLANIKVKNIDGSGADSEWISDGSNSFEIDTKTGTYASVSLPAFSKDLSKLPTNLEEAGKYDTVYPHPFGMVIPSPVREYLYPQWLAQGKNIEYKLVGEDTFLDRKVWVITYTANSSDVTAFIDKETGIIVKYTQNIDGKPFEEMIFTQFNVNPELDGSFFTLPSNFVSK